MKNDWLRRKKIKLHKELTAELMAAMNDDTTLGELIDCLPKHLKDYFLAFKIFGLESEEDSQTLDLFCENFEGSLPNP